MHTCYCQKNIEIMCYTHKTILNLSWIIVQYKNTQKTFYCMQAIWQDFNFNALHNKLTLIGWYHAVALHYSMWDVNIRPCPLYLLLAHMYQIIHCTDPYLLARAFCSWIQSTQKGEMGRHRGGKVIYCRRTSHDQNVWFIPLFKARYKTGQSWLPGVSVLW